MSSTKTLSGKKYSAVPFFGFTFRQNLQHLVLYLIITTLVMVLPTVMMIDNYYDWVERTSDMIRNYLSVVGDYVETISYIGLFVSCGIAVLAGMNTAAYVNSKQHVGCYHSFPVRRETILTCESLTYVIYYVIAMLFGYAVPFVMLLVGVPADAVLAKWSMYLQFALCSVLLFLLIYSAFLLAGSLTGTAVMRFLMVLAIFFLPVVLYLLLVALAGIGNSMLYESYYLSDEIMQRVCLPYRVAYTLKRLDVDGVRSMLLTLIDTVCFMICAFLLHKFRKSELAGNSVVWKPVFHIVRFAAIVLGALFGGWFLWQGLGISQKVYALLIGMLIGGIFALLLANCILYRSSRAMFRGLRSFVGCMVVVFVFMLLVPLNVTGQLGKPYSARNTSVLYIRPNSLGTELIFEDPEEIDFILDQLTDYDSMFSSQTMLQLPAFNPAENELYGQLDEYLQTSIYEDEKWENEDVVAVSTISRESICTQQVTVIQTPKFGIPLALYMQTDANSHFMDTIYASEQLSEQLDFASWLDESKIREVDIRLDERSLTVYSLGGAGDFTVKHDLNFSFHDPAMWEDVMQILKMCAFDPAYRKNTPVVGCIYVYRTESDISGNGGICYPIYAGDIDLVNDVTCLMVQARAKYDGVYVDLKPFESTRDYYKDAKERMQPSSFALLVDLETGETKVLDEETFLQLADATASYLSAQVWYIDDFFRPSDNKYAILYQRDEEDDILIRFRKDAMTDEALATIFADLP